jgi:enoyl-CoA hydratase
MSTESSDKKEFVTYHREGYVGFITLNRPEKLNALNLAVWYSLDRALAEVEQDMEARVAILRGAGRSFCAGLDLSPDNDLIPMITSKPGASQKMIFYREVKRIQAVHTRLERLSIPTIAAIHGHCLGAGLEMVLCCDIRLCTQDAIMALPEATLAIITDVGGLQRLPRVVGQGHAREIAFRGHRFGSNYARSINLVNETYPDKETLDTKALEMAQEIAGNPPYAIQGAKDVFLFSSDVPADRALDYNAARSSMIMPSEDLLEAMSAHLEKRPGKFKGA